jgi:TrmH family RNA methyltransferase
MSVLLNRRLAEWDRLQSPGGRAELGGFSLEGTRSVERAVSADAALHTVFLSESFAQSAQERERKLLARLHAQAQLQCHVLPDPQLAQLNGGRGFGSILGMAHLPPAPDLAKLLPQAPEGFRPGVMVVFESSDPGNVGALVRTALASGACAFVAVGSTDPFHPKAVRTSMGSLFRLPILQFQGEQEMFEALAPLDLCYCGAVAQEGQRLDEFQAPKSRPLALCLGSEAFGLSEAVQARLDQRLTIPMPPQVDSLSINAAASVCLYELLARRH